MSFKRIKNELEPHVHDVVLAKPDGSHVHAAVHCTDNHKYSSKKSDSFHKYMNKHEKELRRRYETERKKGGNKDKIDTYQAK